MILGDMTSLAVRVRNLFRFAAQTPRLGYDHLSIGIFERVGIWVTKS